VRLSPRDRKAFREHGRRGGLRRAGRLEAAARRSIARRAALARWTRARFGAARFRDLGLPGGDVIDRGLSDLAAGRETNEALLVALAAPRLRREGVPVPAVSIRDADHRLYRAMEPVHGALAHARYNALLRLVTSFADACSVVRAGRLRRAR
jgi:hypothetical protein